MHTYRTHHCNELKEEHVNQLVRLSGWVHRKRDHGNLVFIDLRDHYGITQCVTVSGSKIFEIVEKLNNEDVITVTGQVIKREPNTINLKMETGSVELQIDDVVVQSYVTNMLPLQVNSTVEFPEETRLKYRFLDLRREKLHHNLILRSKIIAALRQQMVSQGFLEIQTPILTVSSPEGARDFLVPSRLHPGHFYALPQAPQQFKQLLMVSGFDRYFQIAPCFRDEDARADRSPGEFYQLDFEMAFATQDDVFNAIEPVLSGVFSEFSDKKTHITLPPFPQIAYADAMLKYGTDKPDLRNPLVIRDVTQIFKGSNFTVFAKLIEQGAVVRAVPAPAAANQPRRFFEKLNSWALELGMPGLGYIVFQDGEIKGPIAKFLDDERITLLKQQAEVSAGDALFFVCDKPLKVNKNAGLVRTKMAEELDLIEKDAFRFCWVVDFPLYEWNEQEQKIDFSHNPFSMPQGGLEALETQDPLTIKAFQYDIVCNGIELSSGAIRNHLPDVMYKAFAIAGYGPEVVEEKFAGLLNAFKFGAPPHGGCAPGIDRIVMMLANEPNLREVIAFPMNQQAQDLMMSAPAPVTLKQLKELHLDVKVPKTKKVEENTPVILQQNDQ